MKTLVVGAGPTGLTAAVELARRGLAVDVIEKRAGGSTLSRAVGVNARSMTLLEPSGVAAMLAEEGIKLRSAAFYRGERLLTSLRLDLLDPPYNYMLALPQDRTEAILRGRLEALGGRVRFGVVLEGLEERADSVLVYLSTGEEVYDQLIGADGADSVVRQALGIPFEGFDLPGDWSIADFDSPEWPRNEAMTMFLLRGGGVVLVVPIGPERYRAVSTRPDAIAAIPVPVTVTRLRREGKFLVSVRQAASYGSDRVFLAGDAAHCHSPAGGRGMNLGIEDACDLAARLVVGEMDGYSTARHPRGRKVIAFSERLRKGATSGAPVLRVVRRLIIPIIGGSPFLQKCFVGMLLDRPLRLRRP